MFNKTYLFQELRFRKKVCWNNFVPIYFENTKNKMGLLTILKKVKQKEKELRVTHSLTYLLTYLLTHYYLQVLILGLDNAGKTTIMKKISGEDIHEISPTVYLTFTMNQQVI